MYLSMVFYFFIFLNIFGRGVVDYGCVCIIDVKYFFFLFYLSMYYTLDLISLGFVIPEK